MILPRGVWCSILDLGADVIVLFGDWALYQSVPVFTAGATLTKGVAIVFGLIVFIELLMFLSTAFEGAPKVDANEEEED